MTAVSTRLKRKAVAYARLAAKAHRNGNSAAFKRYSDKELRLREQAARVEKRG